MSYNVATSPCLVGKGRFSIITSNIRKGKAMKKVILIILMCSSVVFADIEISGDVEPGNLATWPSSNHVYIGKTGSGTLNITDGDTVTNNYARVGEESGSNGKVTVDGFGSTWTSNDGLSIGNRGIGTLSVTAGGTVSSNASVIGMLPNSIGEVTVNGSSSVFTCNDAFDVGFWGRGNLNIIDGGTVNSGISGIGFGAGSTGEVTVDGFGSTWTNSSNLRVGFEGNGTLNITGGGLVSVAGNLSTGANLGEGFVNLATGGMLALMGEADDSIHEFLGLVDGTDVIQYWDDSVLDWADITDATYGMDYRLTYITEGELNGYTILTVPEPASFAILGLGGMFIRKNYEGNC